MVYCSVLIPERNAAEAVARLAPQLDALLRRDGRPYELLVIDDDSQPGDVEILEHLRRGTPSLRLLRLDQACGLSAALTAGMAAARGEIVVAIEASDQYAPDQIPRLVEKLARADMVCGRRHRPRPSKLALALIQLPRRLLLGLEVRDPSCLFWAARREALQGLELGAGMHRFLASLVSTRGFRVAEIHVEHQPAESNIQGDTAWPSLGNLLMTWWQRRRWQAFCVTEVGAKCAEPANTNKVLRLEVTSETTAASFQTGDDRAAA